MRKIVILFFALLGSLALSAQQVGNPMQQQLPIDSNVRYGVLDNGLTYYIRHNAYPEKRADFYIAQKVGSMQEEDNQMGLAHFLEHMAFNGTKHFPGRKTMLNYLESIGAQFGSNVNAYTGFDQTVYTLSNIPVIRQQIIDSTLLILHDWSGYIELDDKEIDKERPIIKEEWRTRRGSSLRIWERQLPVIFQNSKYAYRMPIGTMEVVENFEYQTIKDYYKKWYRPDLQAIIIVGDIDADKVEAQVKEMFSKIPMPANPAERIYHDVSDNDAPIVSIESDEEEQASRITYYIKQDPLPKEVKNTAMGYAQHMALSFASRMLTDRFIEISKTAEAPFMNAGTFYNNFFVSKTKDAWTSIVMSKEGRENESVAALIRETERVKRFGFTDAELERAKISYLNNMEQVYNNRNKQTNNSYVEEYVGSFEDGEPIPGIEYEFEMIKQIAPSITSQMINGMMAQLLTEKNNIITITAPKKEGLVLPTKDEVLATIKLVNAEKIEGYMKEVITEPLISEIPKAGKVVKEETDNTLGITTWTLSNGMKVAIKTTDFKDDEIMMSSSSYGGLSWVSDADIREGGFVSSVPYIGGIGNFNSTNLKKVLAGKNANVNVSISDWTQGIGGRSSIKDMETMLQLTYLYFTAPRKDEEMFKIMQATIVSQLKNQESSPENQFSRNTTFARYGTNPRYQTLRPMDAESLDYNKIVELYKQAFANPGSFTFSFVGNVDKATLKPLVETYLASLPSGNKEAKYNTVNTSSRKGNYKTTFDEKMVDPKTKAFMIYSGKLDYNMKNVQYFEALSQVLDIAYVRTIRESEGGTYGVSTRTGMQRIPEGDASLIIAFDTDPEKVNRLVPIIHAELDKIANEGPTDEDFSKVKEYMLKKYEEVLKMNNYWMYVVSTKAFYNDDVYTENQNILKNMTKADVQNVIKELKSQGNLIEVIMNPLKN